MEIEAPPLQVAPYPSPDPSATSVLIQEPEDLSLPTEKPAISTTLDIPEDEILPFDLLEMAIEPESTKPDLLTYLQSLPSDAQPDFSQCEVGVSAQ
jgi:hypothetical protein